MILFFFLNVIQNISDVYIFEFKDAGIVELGDMLFRREDIGAEITVVLLVLCVRGAIGCRESRLALRSAAHGRYSTAFYLGNCFQVLLFFLRDLGKQIFELRVNRAGGMLGVFVDTKLLLPFQVLQQIGFLLG